MENHFFIKAPLCFNTYSKTLEINHEGGIFTISLNGKTIGAVTSNEDKSWDLAGGEFDQETANLIGEGIEKYYDEHFS
ncbi:hypothetical protein DIU31_022445 [Mucilaginibacter rubeus]|uniref:Uncharacterized protein n=2 Tax=Mucilaginibacter rubeus TaxID=2027860 RepID=A0A364WXD5_9SPHI|nr:MULTISPECIES: hypothetical protein [Mucilaginibacter]QEM06138.1 hypothetical protein DIU31_022445 [Mucilaginibacter rubeus]QEM13655.1 hypothetical protein DEO27_027800 [Mucilaginibacter rubeus]QEM18718.1 hypothetical protein DIU38_022670 [Mucilaginibacter gossypii]QTE36288.1 hypothetical protein J3L18_24625 [Mucilaginibacter gossypii]QTE44741.1 hypothetical protein J3L19_05050 [Mucilaginibacter rubeus]